MHYQTNTPKVSQLWPQPHITEALDNKVRVANNTNELQTIRHHEHLCKVHLITAMDSSFCSSSISPTSSSLL